MPHQVDAVARIRSALSEFGGALLCDVVGSGKTFIGLAIAAPVETVVIAPASLREMWREAMRRTGVSAGFASIESLSRGCPSVGDAYLLVVDEAHHFRNSSTLRHKTLARLISGRRILLMTATPIHNSRADLESLASLFLGRRARSLGEAEIARLIVRRNKERVAATTPIPEVPETEWLTIGDNPPFVQKIIALPPAIPFRDAGEAHTLAALGLVRQWASSEAALNAALKRRLARTAALEASLLAGEYPSALELRHWIGGEDCIQLGFSGLGEIPTVTDAGELLEAIGDHREGLRRLISVVARQSSLDATRARHLIRIAAIHRDALIVAFASYEATAVALFKSVVSKIRAAVLTSRGALVAGGRVTRAEVLGQFNPAGAEPREADRIQLLVTTDLLSEGVNLQKAQVIIHLDLPWTQARLAQRVGRLARVGSRHQRVFVIGFLPPASADRVLRTSDRIEAKARYALCALGPDEARIKLPNGNAPTAPPEAQERLREILNSWLAHSRPELPLQGKLVSAAAGTRCGFIALMEKNTEFVLICSLGAEISDRPADVERACRLAGGPNTTLDPCSLAAVLEKIRTWITNAKSADLAGIGPSAFLTVRRRIFKRIDSVAARIPPHDRPRRTILAHRARLLATAPLGAAAENDLLSLVTDSTEVDDDEWLSRVAKVPTRHASPATRDRYSLRALLLLDPPIPPPSS